MNRRNPPAPKITDNFRTVYFKSEKFKSLLRQKGNKVLVERAVNCPCKGDSSNHRSDCQNCGGTGWIFINPCITRALIRSLNMSTRYREWSEESIGTVGITAQPHLDFGYMDRVTIKDGYSIITESAKVYKKTEFEYYANFSYDISSILFEGYFVGHDSPLAFAFGTSIVANQIQIEVDLAEELNVEFKEKFDDNEARGLDTMYSLKYKFRPQFHVIDLPREFFVDYNNRDEPRVGDDSSYDLPEYPRILSELPVNAIAKRSHYDMTRLNSPAIRTLDNSGFYSCKEC